MSAALRRAGLLALLAALQPASAATAPGQYSAQVSGWQAHDARLLAISGRLARANAAYCRDTQSAAGLTLTDFHRFARPAEVSAAMGAPGGVAIQAIAPGSPAAAAGLQAGDPVLAIAGQNVGPPPAKLPRNTYWHDLLHQRIDQALDQHGRVVLRLGNPSREVALTGQPACRARFALLSRGTAAMSEGYRILIAVQLMAEHPDDNEAATMLAHELAHNILGHVALNNAKGRNYLTVRRNEREADRLAPWLMANAGFDPAAAPRFMSRWGPRHGGGITRSPSHDPWQDRAAIISEEVAAIAAMRTQHPGQPLDWRAQLPRIQRD